MTKYKIMFECQKRPFDNFFLLTPFDVGDTNMKENFIGADQSTFRVITVSEHHYKKNI